MSDVQHGSLVDEELDEEVETQVITDADGEPVEFDEDVIDPEVEEYWEAQRESDQIVACGIRLEDLLKVKEVR